MSDQPKQVSELKVSGHTMALEPGLYCIFNTPGGPPPAADTGLPTVRICAAPGRAGGRIEVSGLDRDGWIGPDAATLVRISEMRSDVLVTVYQAAGTRAEAPQLQVVRLSGEPGSAVRPAGAAGAERAAPVQAADVRVMAHIYGLGDVAGAFGAWVGEPKSTRWIEGFGLAPVGDVTAADIEYQAVLGRGWLSPWSEGGQFCGSRAMSLPILGMRVRLKGNAAATHRIVLSATFVDGSEVGPVGDGEACEAPSLAALEAFNIVLEARDGAQKGRGKPPKAGKGAAKPVASEPEPAVAPKVAAKTKATVAAPVASKPARKR